MAHLATWSRVAVSSRLQISGLCQQLSGLHSSPSVRDEHAEDTDEASTSSSTSSSSSSSDERATRRRRTRGMPSEVDIDRMFLRYNRSFKMDEERTWKIGHVAALELRGRTEFRKLLAKQRLDAADAAVAGESLPSLEEQMNVRLAQMEAALRSAGGRR